MKELVKQVARRFWIYYDVVVTGFIVFMAFYIVGLGLIKFVEDALL